MEWCDDYERLRGGRAVGWVGVGIRARAGHEIVAVDGRFHGWEAELEFVLLVQR